MITLHIDQRIAAHDRAIEFRVPDHRRRHEESAVAAALDTEVRG